MSDSDSGDDNHYSEYDYGASPNDIVAADVSSDSNSDDVSSDSNSDDDNHYSEYDYDASPNDYVAADVESGVNLDNEILQLKLSMRGARAKERWVIVGKLVLMRKEREKIMKEYLKLYGKSYGQWDIRKKHPMGYMKWIYPYRGFYRVDTDGSVKMGVSGGCGAIARDWYGKFIAAASGVSDNLSVLYNQVLGVKLGLELAILCQLKKIMVYCNSRFIYQLVCFQRVPYAEDASTVGPVLGEISLLMNYFEDVDFYYCLRGTNQAADYISKLFIEDMEIKLESHRELCKIVDDDASGVPHLCEF